MTWNEANGWSCNASRRLLPIHKTTMSGVLLVDQGDLPSLAVLALESAPQELVLYHYGGADQAGPRREAAARTHESLGVKRLIVDRTPEADLGGNAEKTTEALHEACLLVRAAVVASRLRCGRVIWPRQVALDAAAVGEVVQRASMAASLAQLGRPDEFLIDLPVVDLTDEQLVELAEEAGAPMGAFWPCAGSAARPCGQCRPCLRWQAAFDAAGVEWPWQVVAVRS